jgi:putative transposase
MTAPLSRDPRERIVRPVSGGTSIREAAKRFEVSLSVAIKLIQRVRVTGSTAPARIGGYRRQLLEPHADALREWVAHKKGVTFRGIREELAERGVEVKALPTIADMLHRLGLSHKKVAERGRARLSGCRPSSPPLSGVAVGWEPT